MNEGRENLLLVDSLNLSFRWKHRGETSFSSSFLDTITSLSRSYDASKVIILGDGGSTWRKEKLPSYKGNRKEKYAKQSEEEKRAFEEFMVGYNNALELASNLYPVLKFGGVEADDIAGYIVKHYAKDFEHTWLVSTDKDWDMLISDKVSRFSYKSRKEITVSTWDHHYDYPIDKHIDIKCLTGDAGDNVPGVAGIGPTRAMQLVRDYGGIFDIHASLPLPGKQKFISSLNQFGDGLLTNFELMDLTTYCDEIIGDFAPDIKKVMN